MTATTISPTADTYLDESAPTTVRGATTSHRFGWKTSTQRYVALFQFDLTAAFTDISKVTIQSAILNLTRASSVGSRATDVIGAVCQRSWESAFTHWTIYNSLSSPWTTPGGDFLDVPSQEIVATTWPASGVWSIDLTPIFQDALVNHAGIVNFGLIPKEVVGHAADYIVFYSKEHGTAGNRPDVDLEYLETSELGANPGQVVIVNVGTGG